MVIGTERRKLNMSEKFIIHQVFLLDQTELQLEINHHLSLKNYIASGRMLVDSDGLSFVYLLETEEAYTYIIIPHHYWKDLKTALTKQLPVFLTNNHDRILLTGFQEELAYLIENIKGNSNYGDKMVTEVEVVFG